MSQGTQESNNLYFPPTSLNSEQQSTAPISFPPSSNKPTPG